MLSNGYAFFGQNITYLQENNNKRADRLDETELERGLFAETQKSDGVGGAGEAAGPIDAGRPHWPSAQLRHYVTLATQIFVAQG